MRRSQHRMIFLAASLLAAASAVAIVAVVNTGPAIDICRPARRLLARAEAIASRAATFEQRTALAGLVDGDGAHLPLRLDDTLDTARPLETAATVAGSVEPVLTVDFAGDARPPKVNRGRGSLRNEMLYITGASSVSSVNLVQGSQLPHSSVGRIEIRLRQQTGREFKLEWVQDGQVLNRIALHTVPPFDEFHTYSVDAAQFFQQTMVKPRPEHTIGTLRLRPTGSRRDTVTVDWVRFKSKAARFPKPYGASRTTIAGELRSGIYAHAPSALSWPVTVPDAATLSVGLGVVDAGGPVRFEATVKAGSGTPEKVLAEQIIGLPRWSDHRVDLSRYAGQQVEITLRVGSNEGGIAFWSNPVIRGPRSERPNVLVVLEDAMRADHLSYYGYERRTTPFKDALFADAVRFRRAVSQATKTRPSCPSIMTSLYPTATGVLNFSESLSERHVTLAEALRHVGYSTVSFVQNHNAGPAAGLHQGFSQLFDRQLIGDRPDDRLMALLTRWVDAHAPEEFFLYLHLIDPHGQYDPPERDRAWFQEVAAVSHPIVGRSKNFDPDWIDEPTAAGRNALYDGEILNNDRFLKQLVSHLDRRGVLENTVIVHISDHGEHLGEHDLWGHHPPGFIQGLHVPLTFHFPRRYRGRQVSAPAGLVDVMPTVLDIVGADASGLLMQGDSLLPLLEGGREDHGWLDRLVVSEEVMYRHRKNVPPSGSLLLGKHHIIYSTELPELDEGDAASGGGKDDVPLHVYDMAADPAEDHPLLQVDPDGRLARGVPFVFNELDRLDTVTRQALATDAEVQALDSQVLDQLKALGYIDE